LLLFCAMHLERILVKNPTPANPDRRHPLCNNPASKGRDQPDTTKEPTRFPPKQAAALKRTAVQIGREFSSKSPRGNVRLKRIISLSLHQSVPEQASSSHRGFPQRSMTN